MKTMMKAMMKTTTMAMMMAMMTTMIIDRTVARTAGKVFLILSKTTTGLGFAGGQSLVPPWLGEASTNRKCEPLTIASRSVPWGSGGVPPENNTTRLFFAGPCLLHLRGQRVALRGLLGHLEWTLTFEELNNFNLPPEKDAKGTLQLGRMSMVTQSSVKPTQGVGGVPPKNADLSQLASHIHSSEGNKMSKS
ncbi:hypothetical protein TRICI_003209 [Trichomonascus ciferrii]|uniref:Uncharacterized protein n=1 Tax=Trichomonascus ciferrii TaxID=44093 RepID=A0A642V3U0_9ASCO|nr:hypothetical protein TRICI_003209 [Trichomonascus ciferrii]